MEFGQIRPVDPDILKARVRSLNENPPAYNLRLVCYQDPGVL